MGHHGVGNAHEADEEWQTTNPYYQGLILVHPCQ